MKKTLLIMSTEIGNSLRRKTFLLFGFGLPLVLGIVALAFMVANRDAGPVVPQQEPATTSATAQSQRAGYVDQSGLIRQLPADLSVGRLQSFEDEAAAQAALDSGLIDGYFVVPADYRQAGQVTFITPTHNPLRGNLTTDPLQWALLVNLLNGDAELAAAIREPLRVTARPLVTVEGSAVEESWVVELLPTLMVLVLYIVILVPAGTLVNAVTDEKKNRVMEVLITSVSARQMITGKILALGLLGLLQAALWLGLFWGVVAFGGNALRIPEGYQLPEGLFVWSIVYVVLGYAVYGAQLAGVGALAPDVKDTRSANLVVMSPLILAYVLNMVIITNPDGPIALLLSLFPLTSPVAMISRMSVTVVPFWQLALSAALLLGTAMLCVRVVSRLFRAQMMLSGQAFSVGRFYRALLVRTPA